MVTQIHIGKQIQMIRTLRGLRLRKLGALSGIDFTYLSRFENGKRIPNSSQIQAIEAALEVKFDDPEIQAAFSILAGHSSTGHAQQELPNAQ